MFQRKYSASGGQLEEPLSGAPSGKTLGTMLPVLGGLDTVTYMRSPE